MAKSPPVIPWKRYWCPLGQPINCGASGREFLADPEGDFGRIWSPNVFELAQILDRPCLVLCGEPGMGKTKAIEMARIMIISRPGTDPEPIWLAFRDIPNEQVFHRETFETAKWQSWLKSESRLTLIIDGIDEGLIRVQGFIPYLARQLRDAPLARLQVILVCRTAEWSLAEGDQLVGLWGSPHSEAVFELCPLREEDARLAAQTWGVDGGKFMSEIFEQNVTGLAARPTTLFFLLREFAARGAFPGTHFDLYQAGCKRLCEEHDHMRIAAFRFQPPTSQQFTLAEIHKMSSRIAALLMLCGKSAIHVGCHDDADPSDLSLEDIAATGKDSELAQAALSTGLFSARGPGRLGFAHQTFAECLAAHALLDSAIPQVRSALCQKDGLVEHVVPQLAETAAWLAAAREDFLEFLVRQEPEVLLRSDVSQVKAQHKEELVGALLQRAKDEIAFDARDTSRFYSGLRHPGLAKQLWDYINNSALNVVVRHMAIEIASDCKLEELVTRFLALMRTESNPSIRRYLAQSLENITPSHRAEELIPLAKGNVGRDWDDTLKGCALHVLIPKVWSVSDALPFLTPPNENIHGGYHSALSYHIPQHIQSHDLRPLLLKLVDWSNCFDSLNPYHAIAEKVVVEAVKQIHDAEIAELTVEVWRAKSREFLHFAGERKSEFRALLDGDSPLRLRFVAAILNSPGTTVDDVHRLVYVAHDQSLVSPLDFEWLLKGITRAPEPRRAVWAEAISLMVFADTVTACWDLLLDRIEALPELKARFAWLRAYDLDEPEARRLKDLWLADKRRREDWDRRKQSTASIESRIERDLTEIQAGNTFWWMRLCDDLAIQPGDTRSTPATYDITESPGWQRADTQRRKVITEAARQFLTRHHDGYAEKGERTNYSDPGYVAIWLLRDVIRESSDLRAAVARKWIDAITGRFNNAGDYHQEMIALAYEINPDWTVQGLLREILDDDTRHGQILALRAYQRCWDSRLTKTLVDLITSDRLKPGCIESALSFLTEVDAKAGVDCLKLLLPPGIELDEAQRERTKGVLCVAVAKIPNETWEIVWPLMVAHTEFAEHVLGKLAYGMDYSPKGAVFPLISENQLAEVYLLLNRVFPPAQDPPFTSGTVTSRQAVVQFRADLIGALTARGTEDACKQLLRLSESVPSERLWFRWRYWEALRLKRRKGWQPLSPEVIRSVLENPAARVVEDENDLIDVILESLCRFQEHLTKSSPPQAGFLWNYEGSGNQRKSFSPKDEEDLSDMIAVWLTNDLGPKAGVVIGREVQPRRGQRTDIKVVAIPTEAGGCRPLTVVVEVKGCWHREVRTAIKTQLVEDYLNMNGWTHGLYVVGWYVCDQWNNPAKPLTCNLDSKNYEDACKEMENLAAPYTGEGVSAIVKAVCLDCRFPA